MKTSLTGLNLIEMNESLRKEMYHDQVGLPTIGWGHLLTQSELSSGKIQLGGEPIRWGNGITDAEAQAILTTDVEKVERVIAYWVRVPLTQFQFDALVSFVFNIGDEAFVKSTLLKLLNEDKFLLVPEQIKKWIYSKGIVLPVLIERRKREAAMWEGTI